MKRTMNPVKTLWMHSVPQLRKIAIKEGVDVSRIQSPTRKKPWVDAILSKRQAKAGTVTTIIKSDREGQPDTVQKPTKIESPLYYQTQLGGAS